MKIRVAHIISGLGIGGAERHLVNLLNAMPAEYRAVVCFGPKLPGPTFHQDLDIAIEQTFIRIRRRSMPLGVLRLARFFASKEINVVHTHMYGSNLVGTIAARLAGVPVIVTTEHGENPWKGPYHRWLERRVISPLADVRFCVSPRILAVRRDRDGVPESKLRLTVNGTVMPALAGAKAGNAILKIGTVGRFIPAKDYVGLLHAVAQLRDRGYELKLCIVGDGPEADNLRATVDELKLQSMVEFPGMVADIDNWYRRFDIYVSSSVREGLAVALLEAMAHGLPIVATDVGASAEAVKHGEGGLIVPPGKPVMIADALGQLLDDTELRATLGRNARRRVQEHYSVATVAEAHLATYHELLSKKVSGSNALFG